MDGPPVVRIMSRRQNSSSPPSALSANNLASINSSRAVSSVSIPDSQSPLSPQPLSPLSIVPDNVPNSDAESDGPAVVSPTVISPVLQNQLMTTPKLVVLRRPASTSSLSPVSSNASPLPLPPPPLPLKQSQSVPLKAQTPASIARRQPIVVSSSPPPPASEAIHKQEENAQIQQQEEEHVDEHQQQMLKTLERREEEYSKARARIFENDSDQNQLLDKEKQLPIVSDELASVDNTRKKAEALAVTVGNISISSTPANEPDWVPHPRRKGPDADEMHEYVRNVPIPGFAFASTSSSSYSLYSSNHVHHHQAHLQSQHPPHIQFLSSPPSPSHASCPPTHPLPAPPTMIVNGNVIGFSSSVASAPSQAQMQLPSSTGISMPFMASSVPIIPHAAYPLPFAPSALSEMPSPMSQNFASASHLYPALPSPYHGSFSYVPANMLASSPWQHASASISTPPSPDASAPVFSSSVPSSTVSASSHSSSTERHSKQHQQQCKKQNRSPNQLQSNQPPVPESAPSQSVLVASSVPSASANGAPTFSFSFPRKEIKPWYPKHINRNGLE